eukprot:3940745-Rhodomonas_salina.3
MLCTARIGLRARYATTGTDVGYATTVRVSLLHPLVQAAAVQGTLGDTPSAEIKCTSAHSPYSFVPASLDLDFLRPLHPMCVRARYAESGTNRAYGVTAEATVQCADATAVFSDVAVVS